VCRCPGRHVAAELIDRVRSMLMSGLPMTLMLSGGHTGTIARDRSEKMVAGAFQV